MEMYNNWYANNIIIPLKSIHDAAARINFIIDRKMEFIANNRNEEATMLVQVIDSLIDKEKFAMQVNIAASRENEKTNQTKEEPEAFLDFSDNSIAERIVFMNELGILEYLHNKLLKEALGFSVNKLAEVVSSFSGVSQRTLQSYINPIYSNGVVEKNNPLTEKNIKKAQQKLLKMGLKIK